MHTEFIVETRGRGTYEITDDILAWVRGSGIAQGLLTLFVRHTSCSLVIQENADLSVRHDLDAYIDRLVPDADAPEMRYLTHTYEGADDMPAHIKAALLPVSLQIPVADSRPLLGTWQGIYLWEHRTAPHRRKVAAHLLAG